MDMRAMREEPKAVEQLKRPPTTLPARNRTDQRPGVGAVKTAAFQYLLRRASRFTKYPCTEKPPYRFPHTAAIRSFIEQVAVRPGASQCQHQHIIFNTVDE